MEYFLAKIDEKVLRKESISEELVHAPVPPQYSRAPVNQLNRNSADAVRKFVDAPEVSKGKLFVAGYSAAPQSRHLAPEQSVDMCRKRKDFFAGLITMTALTVGVSAAVMASIPSCFRNLAKKRVEEDVHPKQLAQAEPKQLKYDLTEEEEMKKLFKLNALPFKTLLRQPAWAERLIHVRPNTSLFNYEYKSGKWLCLSLDDFTWESAKEWARNAKTLAGKDNFHLLKMVVMGNTYKMTDEQIYRARFEFLQVGADFFEYPSENANFEQALSAFNDELRSPVETELASQPMSKLPIAA